jgi:hypothetical protein
METELAYRTELEYYLKKVVRKVIKERNIGLSEQNRNRRSNSRFYITAIESTHYAGADNLELTQEERERVIELLLGQEKVISLLYDNQTPQFNTKQSAFAP